MVKIITVNIEKGGTGKTTQVFNIGEYGAQNRKNKILLIDQDKSNNLSKRYSKYDVGLIREENTTNALYKGMDVKPLHIHDNLDILMAGTDLSEIDTEIKDRVNNRLILFSWITKNYDELNEKYDYILIDTHNDTTLITQNAWAVSDVIIGVSDPSMDGFEALLKLGRDIEKLQAELVEVRTGESYMIAQYFILGNKLKHNTNSSREFREIIEKERNYLGSVQDKELVHIGNLDMIPLVEYAQDKKIFSEHKDFFKNTFKLYDKIFNITDGKKAE
ncbi:ParA family protein [Listeria monocytogenes]|uniref:ParA family protein n=2 Tax=Listeria monocytogenes TaxID=1639 RepID=A0AB74N9U9_LISMN|nr:MULTISPECIES: ParA family protein [Listeria]EAF4459199.1 ParA family protein [Listeria monocytogenes serotype 1/2a]EAC4362773.1 ParA family protein [Listeria monocytogenes]EAC6224290.1 ParA family protein [Listeria monocytogenes]EAD2626110.1 ParA family protein [Listeria monocytogenes]EAD9125242.1 ParA family protein [Listeria monocytogenes]